MAWHPFIEFKLIGVISSLSFEKGKKKGMAVLEVLDSNIQFQANTNKKDEELNMKFCVLFKNKIYILIKFCSS